MEDLPFDGCNHDNKQRIAAKNNDTESRMADFQVPFYPLLT
jgi:hypothetical protein